MRKIFVAYDFSGGGTLSTDLQTISGHHLSGLDVVWPGGSGMEGPGGLWEQKVKPGIEGCDRLVAFADLPNANVGFEIGYALSRKKEVGVAHIRSNPHRWIKRDPFRGEFVQRLDNVDDICEFLNLENWPGSEHLVEGGGSSVLFLCPGKSGAAFQKFRDESWILPDRERWDLRSFSRVFKDIGLVVWVISPHNDGDTCRDGPENAALSILAGFAEGHENLDLIVLRSSDAREVADVASYELCFETIEQFKNLVFLINAGWNAPDRPTHLHFRDWLPTLENTPVFANVDFGVEKPGPTIFENPVPKARTRPKRAVAMARAIAATVVLALGIIGIGSLDYFNRCPSKIVYGNEFNSGTVVRLRAENFDTQAELEATVGEMGDLKIEIAEFEIKEEFRDTDKAPRVFLQVVKPKNMVFEEYAWDDDANYRSESPWAIPHDRNRISCKLITRGQWDQKKFEKATHEVSRHFAELGQDDREKLLETLLNKSNLTLEALRKSVSEKEIPGVGLTAAVQKVDRGKIVAESSSPGRAEPLSPKEKEALTAVVASTGALIRTGDRNLANRLPASGLVVGDHFVFTSRSVLPTGFAPEKLPAVLPEGASLAFSLADRIEQDQELMPVQDVVAIQPEYVVLMVPTAGQRVRRNLGEYFPTKKVEGMLSKDFVFITPGDRDEKCVAIGYPVATEDTPRQFQKLLALSTKSGFQPRKRISVGRVYTSNPVWSTHTATTMGGTEGGPVAFINGSEVGIMGFNRGGMWLGGGYQLNATYNLGSSSMEDGRAKELVKNCFIAYAGDEIRGLPETMLGEREIWQAYFTPEMGTYEMRKKLAEIRTTAWAYRQSGDGPASYRHFRNGWMEFRDADGRKEAHFLRSIENFERLLKNDPQYYIAWLRLGEAYDKTLQRIKSYETLKNGYYVFKDHSKNSPVGNSNWEREIEASFLNTLFLVCKILGKHDENPDETSIYGPGQFELEAEKYFKLLQETCPYHPTLVGHDN